MAFQTRNPLHHHSLQASSSNRPSFLYPRSPSASANFAEAVQSGLNANTKAAKTGPFTPVALPTPPPSITRSTTGCGCAHDLTAATDINTTASHGPFPRVILAHSEWPAIHADSSAHPSQSRSLQYPTLYNRSHTFPPTGFPARRDTITSASNNQLTSHPMDSFPHAPPPPYRRTPPHSNESLGEQLVERTNSRPVSTRKLSASAANLGRAGPLGHGFDAFSSTPSPSPSSVHIRTASNSTVQSHADRKRLRITIPETQAVNGPPSPLQPVTVAYLPRSTAGDICSSPVEATFSHWDGQLPNGSAHAFDASYDEAYEGHCAGLPALKTVRFASQDVQYSPRSPPRLARQAYIPLPPEVSEDELDDHCYETPLVASFNMLRLHDDSASGLSAVRGYHGSPINDKIHLMANLPQDADADLLSPLPLTAAPTYRLEDLTEQISRCLYATERMHLSLASSTTKVRSTDVQPICAALTSSFTGIKAEATQSPPDLELLVRAHGAEWRRKYERVILSLDRNMQHFQRILDQVSGRHPQSRHLVTLKDTLVRFARKFEDIECRLRVFHHHISLLEMQAEYRELTVAAREEADAERACRQTYKAISQEVRARRQALKEQIRREEEAVRVRWARQGARWGRGTR